MRTRACAVRIGVGLPTLDYVSSEARMQERAAQRTTETRFAERLLGWLDANLPTLPPDCPERRLMDYIASELASRHGLPPLGTPRLATLDDATAEIMARLDEAGAEPFAPMTPEQWAIFAAGLPFSLDEIADSSARSVAEWMPNADGRPRIVLAQAFHACGVVKGALVQSWRR